jgi:outer membrane protein assembly factor BamD (BamD/ComL family)
MSIMGKTQERLEEALRAYKTFIKSFPNSKYVKDAERIHEDITKRMGYLN